MRFSMLAILAPGCGTISNAEFLDDADFLAALPREEQSLQVEGSSAAKAEAGGPSLRRGAVAASAGVNVFILGLLGAVDDLRDLPPATRTDDGRTWGPYTWLESVSVTAEVSRTATVYDWSFLGRSGSETAEFLAGTHYAGETVRSGDGVFGYDIGAVCGWSSADCAGRLEVDYDLRQATDLVVDVIDYATADRDPVSYRYAYWGDGQVGDFEFAADLDFDWDDTDEEGHAEQRMRWIAGEGGRADATLTGAGLGRLSLDVAQCWDAALELTYQWDSAGQLERVGEEEDCVYAEGGGVERI